MVDIQSKEVIDKVSDELKIQPAMKIPREIMDKIQLVYNVNPTNSGNIIKAVTKITSGAVGFFTTPTTRDFFLTSAFLQNQSDVAATNTLGSLTVVVGGITIPILEFSKITLTIFNDSLTLSFPNPIKIDRGTAVVLNNTFGLGVSVSSAGITGYTTDPQ